MLGSMKKPRRYMLDQPFRHAVVNDDRPGRRVEHGRCCPGGHTNSPDSGIGDEGTKSGAQRVARFCTSGIQTADTQGFESGPGSAARHG